MKENIQSPRARIDEADKRLVQLAARFELEAKPHAPLPAHIMQPFYDYLEEHDTPPYLIYNFAQPLNLCSLNTLDLEITLRGACDQIIERHKAVSLIAQKKKGKGCTDSFVPERHREVIQNAERTAQDVAWDPRTAGYIIRKFADSAVREQNTFLNMPPEKNAEPKAGYIARTLQTMEKDI